MDGTKGQGLIPDACQLNIRDRLSGARVQCQNPGPQPKYDGRREFAGPNMRGARPLTPANGSTDYSFTPSRSQTDSPSWIPLAFRCGYVRNRK